MNAQSAYDDLIRRSRELALLTSCSSLLSWDEQTYMPRGGSAHRGNQLALLAGLHHEKFTDSRIGDLLDALERSDLKTDPDSAAAVNVRELRRVYDRMTRLPRALVEDLARTTSMAQQEWVVARKKNDWPHFRPWLEKIVGLKRREAECLARGPDLYDGLLDQFEPEARSRDIATLFTALRRELVPLVNAIKESPTRPNLAILRRDYPVERQRVFGEAVAAAIGFDFQRGRLDTAAHPFCSGIGPGDCRLTTRFHPQNFSEAFFGVLHEAGHGLYDQGLDPAHFGTPMGEAVSLGVHESQSRLWENAVGRSRSFWKHYFPLARQVFREALNDVGLDEFHLAVNHVEPSPIRVEADEATYNLHVLIRFDLERALIADDLQPKDVPGAWNATYREYLGITPRNDAEGCLQDIHWSAGLFGYFPTYTLGNLYAAQFFAQANKDLGDLGQPFAIGEFGGLLGWLREKVHRHGHRYSSAQLVERVTGSAPDHRPLMASLRQKYAELYHI